MAAMESLSFCDPQANSQPEPPMAQAPKPTGVMCRLELPSLRVSIFNPFFGRDSTIAAWRHQWLTVFYWRREGLEHLGHALVQIFFVLRGLVGQRVFRTSAPDQLLGVCVVKVHNQGSFLVVLFGRRRLTHSSESAPTPSPAEALIEGLKSSLGLGRLDCNDGHFAAARHLSPALRG